MKKQLNTDAVTNELKGASLFFSRPDAQPPAPAEETVAVPPPPPAKSIQAGDRPSGTPSVRPDGRTPVRRLTRMPFEFYQDQLEALKRISLEAKLRGEKGSMSEMVREAVDRYLQDRVTEDSS